MQPGPVPTIVVGTGLSLVSYFVQREDHGITEGGDPLRAAPVPFLFYLGKDFGAEICCHPSPFSV